MNHTTYKTVSKKRKYTYNKMNIVKQHFKVTPRTLLRLIEAEIVYYFQSLLCRGPLNQDFLCFSLVLLAVEFCYLPCADTL
jgi:hypothetical protein